MGTTGPRASSPGPRQVPPVKEHSGASSGKPAFTPSRKGRGAVGPVALFWGSVWGNLLLANLYCPLVVLIFWTDCNFSLFFFKCYLKTLFVLYWSVGDEQRCDGFGGQKGAQPHTHAPAAPLGGQQRGAATHTRTRCAPRIKALCKTVLRAVQ